MTTKTKRKTKAKATKRREPASVLAWGILNSLNRLLHIGWSRKQADDRCYEGERVVRVRITVVPRGAKR